MYRYILLAVLFLSTSALRADEMLRPDVARIAASVKKILDSRSAESVAVGQFAAPAGHAANYGPGICHMLCEELHGMKVRVDDKAAYKVQGEFVKGLIKDADAPGDVLVLKLNFRIYDKTGEQVTELPLRIEIRKNDLLAKALGISGPLSPKGDYYQRNEEVQKSLGAKTTHCDGTRIVAGAKSPFAVEILAKSAVKAQAEPRTPSYEGNDLFVDIRRGEMYEVRLHNRSKLEAAVTLDIDGLSVFTFSELRNPKTGAPKYSHFILPPESVTVIQGWHRRNKGPDNFLSFLVTAYGEGASRLVPQPSGKVGVITVTFAYAWQGKEPPPEEKGAREGRNETGFGPPITQAVQEVSRHIGVVRDVVSVRYSR